MPAEFFVLFKGGGPKPRSVCDHDATGGVDGGERADGDAVGCDRGSRTDAALEVDRGRAGTGANAAEGKVHRCRCRGRIGQLAIGRIEAPILVATIEQVEKNGARHDRHPRRADDVAAPVFAHIGLHAGGGVEPESGAAGQHDRLDAVNRHGGVEKIDLACAGATAAHVDGGTAGSSNTITVVPVATCAS